MDILVTKLNATAEVADLTEAGREFVDAYVGPITSVLDSGRILVPLEAVPDLLAAAAESGVTTKVKFG
jgi:hypothetical protein